MLKRTDIHLIQLEIASVVLLLIHDHDQSVTVTLLILSYLALLASCTALSVKYLRGHSYAYPACLALELPLMACSVQFLYPLYALIFLPLWVYRVHRAVHMGFAYLLTAAAVLVCIPWYTASGRGAYLIGLGMALCAGIILSKQERQELKVLEQERRTHLLQIQNKNKLLSTLAHELRTPLTVIQTSTEILQEGRPGDVNETQKRFLDSTHANVRRMIRLVENILAQIKVEHTLFSLEKQQMDIRTVIRRVIRNMGPFLDDQRQEVRYAFSNTIDHVLADDKWIEQVMINLIHNSSKHVGPGGSILVSVKQNELCVVVSVSDNGSGIDRRERPMIFDEFFQGTDTKNDIGNGAGLGLAIVRDIIEKHDGKVYISSSAGHGTIVSFTLPKECVSV
jgi:signal transduction histidine kinase